MQDRSKTALVVESLQNRWSSNIMPKRHFWRITRKQNEADDGYFDDSGGEGGGTETEVDWGVALTGVKEAHTSWMGEHKTEKISQYEKSHNLILK